MGIVQRDSFRITLISYAGAGLGYLNKVFLFTNFLETEQVGLANLMVTIALIYAQFAALGTRNVITRFFPFFRNKENHHNGFLFAIMALSLAGFTIATLVFIALQNPFAQLYGSSSPLLVDYAWYILPLALATLFYNLFESYLRSLLSNVLPTLTHEIVLRLFVTLAITLFALGIIAFPLFVILYVIAYCLPAVILVFYTASKGWLLVRPRWTPLLRRLGKIMIVYGLYSLLSNLSSFLLVSIDALMVAGMIDLGAAGIYTTMVFMTSVILIPYRSMVKVAAPLVAGYWKSRSMDQLQTICRKATAGNLVVGASLFMLIWVNLDAVFYFMAPEYVAGRYVFLFLGIGKLIDMSAGLNATILNNSKKYRYELIFTVLMLASTVLLNLLLIPPYGINGAALASMLTLTLFNVLRVVFVYRHFRLKAFNKKDIFVPAILAIIMTASAFVDTGLHPLADMPIRSAIAAGLFLLPVKMLKISPEMNQWVLETIASLRKRLF